MSAIGELGDEQEASSPNIIYMWLLLPDIVSSLKEKDGWFSVAMIAGESECSVDIGLIQDVRKLADKLELCPV